MNYSTTTIVSQNIIEKTKAALEANGINVIVAENAEEAKQKVLELIPENSEVMTMTSVTLETAGITKEINESGKFDAFRNKLYGGEGGLSPREKKKTGGAAEYTVGSVHAVTEDGKVLIASNTGSQLGAYSYGSDHVIWVVGAQKIVKDIDAGMERIYNYVLPLESERAHKAYGIPGSNVSKMLIVNKEVAPNRITMVIVKEALGF